MDKNTALAAVISFSDAIRAAYQPVKVVLYGSYARGDQQDSSDIDVAVIVDEIEGDFLDAEAGLYRIRRSIDDRRPASGLDGGGRVVLGVTDRRPREVVGTKAFAQPERARIQCASAASGNSTERKGFLSWYEQLWSVIEARNDTQRRQSPGLPVGRKYLYSPVSTSNND